jgi:hypothetical protein
MQSTPQSDKRRALAISIVVAGFLLPVFLGIWYVAAIALLFALPGADTGDSGWSVKGWWVSPAIALLAVLAVASDVLVGVRLYRRKLRAIPSSTSAPS